MDDWDDPPPEAYGRVTDPERFRPLHAAADRLLADLETRYEVTRSNVELTPEERRWRRDVDRALRLTPAGDGAVLTVIFTGFPGVVLQAGHAFETTYPLCGCDACADDPTRLAEDMADDAEAIATGGLAEARRSHRVRPDTVTLTLTRANGQDRRQGALQRPDDRRHAVPVGRTSWAPWPTR